MPKKIEEMWGRSSPRLRETLDMSIKSVEQRFKPQSEAAKQILAEAAAVAERKTKQK